MNLTRVRGFENVLLLFGRNEFFNLDTPLKKKADVMRFVEQANRNRCPTLFHAENYSPIRRPCRQGSPSTLHRMPICKCGVGQ
jgi:hypothetical protein